MWISVYDIYKRQKVYIHEQSIMLVDQKRMETREGTAKEVVRLILVDGRDVLTTDPLEQVCKALGIEQNMQEGEPL